MALVTVGIGSYPEGKWHLLLATEIPQVAGAAKLWTL